MKTHPDLQIRDLTDPLAGPHALQLLIDDVVAALVHAWGCEARVVRASPVVDVADNYDRLHYAPDAVARDRRYSRYVDERTMLRSHTTAMIPPALRAPRPDDVLLACPGIVYRRDAIDRLHTGEPHQIDLWRVRRGARLDAADLRAMIDVVVGALLPGRKARTSPARHPYTVDGLQIDVAIDGQWLEIGECGLALPALLDDDSSGLAMGLGLDRLLMLRKGIDDIRLLRATDARIAKQMLDLSPYRAVSAMPPVRRDLSIAIDADDDVETMGDRVRAALGARARAVEEVTIVSETPYAELPPAARARSGIAPGQKNVLVRVVLRDPERTLTHDEATVLRDDVYAAIHRGEAHQWAARSA
jgi:phenylalanyl-tRNA synthetase alpha chain